MRFFASCLVLAMCLSMVDTNLLFPVSAEGDAVTEEPTQEIEQTDPVEETTPEVTDPVQDPTPDSEPTVPEETVTPEQPDEPAGEVPTEEADTGEEPVQPEAAEEEKSAPETMTVQALQAARAGEEYLSVQVKDTDGATIVTSQVKLGLGWVRDSQTLPLDLQENGKHYSFKEVKVNNQTVVYTAKYNGQIYYSSNGVTAQKLPENTQFDVAYWEYYTVTFNRSTELDGVNPEDMAVIKADNQELRYPDNQDKSLIPVLSESRSPVPNAESVRVYKGELLGWNLVPSIVEMGSSYVVLSVSKNNEVLDSSTYKNGGGYTESVTQDTVFRFNLGHNDKVYVSFDSASTGTSTISDDGYEVNTKEIKFSVTTKKESKTDGDTFDALQLRVLGKDGEFEYLDLQVPDSETVQVSVVSGYRISINREAELVDYNIIIPKYSYTYNFTVTREDGNPIYNDLYFVGIGRSNAVSRLDVVFDEHIHMAKASDDGTIVDIYSDKPHTLNNSHSTETFYVSAKTGYKIGTPELKEVGSFLGSISFVGNKLQVIPINGSASDKQASEKGFTHLINVKKNYLYAHYKLTVTSEAIPTVIRIKNDAGELLFNEIHGSIEENNGPITLPDYSDSGVSEDKEFVGWVLNKDEEQVFSANDEFFINESTWNLGVDDSSGNSTVRVFEFTPLFVERDTLYVVEHYLQKDDGSWPEGNEQPFISSKASSPNIQNDYVIGLPKQFEGYHLDETKTDAEGQRGLQILNGKPVDEKGNPINNAVIRLYYAKDIQHGHLSIHNHVSGDLANKNKQFSYQIIAEPAVENFPVKELTDKGFKSSSDGGQYVKSVSLSHDDSHVMQDLPITNCTYTVKLTTEDSFYTTSKVVKINDTEMEDSGDTKSHTFDANAMTPNASHEVHFTHTAQDVVPAGNIFDDNGFDLVLASTATLALLCGIYAVVRKKLRLR